jgi:hypothetical protein
VILPTTEQKAAASAGAEHDPGRTLLRDRSRTESLIRTCGVNRTRQERNMIMEPLMATAAEATCSV